MLTGTQGLSFELGPGLGSNWVPGSGGGYFDPWIPAMEDTAIAASFAATEWNAEDVENDPVVLAYNDATEASDFAAAEWNA